MGDEAKRAGEFAEVPCLHPVSHTFRCGLPESHEAHDPLGKVPWPGGIFMDDKPHPYDSLPLCPEDEPPLFGPWAPALTDRSGAGE